MASDPAWDTPEHSPQIHSTAERVRDQTGEGTVTVRLDSFGSDVLKGREFDTTRTVGLSWTRVFVPFGSPRADTGSPRRGGWRLVLLTDLKEVHVDGLKIYPC